MDEKTIGIGVVALVVGVAVGYVAAPKGPDMAAIGKRMAQTMEPVSAANQSLDEKLSALGDSMASLTERLDSLEGTVQDAAAKVGEDLSGKVDTMSADVKDTLSKLSEGQSGLDQRMGKLVETSEKAHQAMAAQQPASAAGGSGDAKAAEGSGNDTADAKAAAGESSGGEGGAQKAAASGGSGSGGSGSGGDGLRPGQTGVYGDGAVRVFVSRVDEEGGAARLNMNGRNMMLKAGSSKAVMGGGTDCLVTLDGLSGGAAQLSAQCGADMPEPQGYGVGETAMLGDGKVRVFVSGADEDAGTARIAVNGFQTQTLKAGDSVAIQDSTCKVSLDGFDRGHVSLGYSCS
ncbi:hypothetical protein [Oceaniglobus roseus]|uniref:hypothetical protein n=1 Tax=Oceaniglobus roseus TaxID=1737570 RepID=UPI000C7F5772|nr:hypothetical protein [Kandeliimicrobium roseum]